jgi:hypothetical protein
MALPSVGGGYQIGDGNQNEVQMFAAPAPVAKTVTTTLVASDLLTQLITSNPGASTAATYTLPTATQMEAAVGNMKLNTGFDFFIINTSVTAGETTTLAVGTGWTLVGSGLIAITTTGHFRARQVAVGSWSVYRI